MKAYGLLPKHASRDLFKIHNVCRRGVMHRLWNAQTLDELSLLAVIPCQGQGALRVTYGGQQAASPFESHVSPKQRYTLVLQAAVCKTLAEPLSKLTLWEKHDDADTRWSQGEVTALKKQSAFCSFFYTVSQACDVITDPTGVGGLKYLCWSQSQVPRSNQQLFLTRGR